METTINVIWLDELKKDIDEYTLFVKSTLSNVADLLGKIG
jgi:hypothetical protein